MDLEEKAKKYESLQRHPGWELFLSEVGDMIALENSRHLAIERDLSEVNFSNGRACGLKAALSLPAKTIDQFNREVLTDDSQGAI